MKLLSLLSPGVPALFMSLGVTAGAMYVTISAAGSNAVALPDAEAATTTATVARSKLAAPLEDSTVQLTDDGHLTGRLSTILAPSGELLPSTDVNVRLIHVSGEERTAVTGPDGTFEIEDVRPGIYTVKADGEAGMLSMAIRAVRSYDVAAATPVALSLDVLLDTALASAENVPAIEDIIASTVVKADTSEAHDGPVSAGDGTSAGEGSYLGHNQIQLQPNGSLDGRVSLISRSSTELLPVEDLTVMFIQGGTIIASTKVETDGTFTQHNILPGVYSMIVAGSDGIGYIGVDLISGFAAQNQQTKYVPTAMHAVQDTATIGMVRGAGADGDGDDSDDDQDDSEEDSVAENEGEPEPEPGETPPPGGIPNPAGGGVGGGGGGFGGDGGFGELLGLAGAALGAAALARDDSSSASGQPPASPAN